MFRERELPRDVTAPEHARRLASEWLGDLLGEDELETARLVVSELVSNAVMHGRGRIWLGVDVDRERMRIEVTDEGTGFAHELRDVPFRALHGRGLLIVDATTSRWGIDEGTTHVWAEIEREGPRLDTGHSPQPGE